MAFHLARRVALTRLLQSAACLGGMLSWTPAMAQSLPTTTSGDRVPATTQAAQPVSTTNSTSASAPEAAPDGSFRVQDIVVTAQRRFEKLQDVPIAVTALDRQSLLGAGIDGSAQLGKAVPGLVFNMQVGGEGQPRIRGVGVSANGPGLENPVALYIDGVYYAAAAGALFSMSDVAQIAVLKGPQGTLFGRNATGGLIQVTTKDPSHHLTIDLDGTVGTKKSYGANLYIADGLSDTLAAGFAFNLDNQDEGFGINVPTHQDIQTHRSIAMRGKLLFEPDSATRVTLSGDYARRRSSEFAERVVGYEFFTGLPDAGGPRDINQNFVPNNFNNSYGATLNAQHDFDGVKLVSITGYRHTMSYVFFDGESTPLDLIRVSLRDKEDQFSQELQLLSNTKGRFSWQAGAFYFHGIGKFDPNYTDTFFPAATAPFATVHNQIVFRAREALNSYAAYAQGTYKIDDRTDFTAGLRYTIDARTHHNENTFTQISPPAFFTVPTTVNNDQKTFRKLTWRFALDHHFTDDVLGYLSYNRGFKSGTFNPQAQPNQPQTKPGPLAPEVLDAFEGGLKTEFLDHRVRLNAAAYYYKYKNIQVSQFSNNIEIVYTGDGATMYGLDADVTARVTRAFTLNGGVALIHGRYDHFVNAFVATPNRGVAQGCVYTFGCGANTVTLNGVATGGHLQNTPTATFNGGGSYKLETTAGDFLLTANYYYNSGFYSEPVNRLMQPHFSVVDASLTWTAPGKHFDVRIWGKNLADTLYAEQLAAVDTADLRTPAPGRTLGVTAGVHF